MITRPLLLLTSLGRFMPPVITFQSPLKSNLWMQGNKGCIDRLTRFGYGEDANPGTYYRLGNPAVIRADGLGKFFDVFGTRIVALSNATFTLEGPGPFVLVGDSESGKSTFLRMVCRGMQPSKGRLTVEQPTAKSSRGETQAGSYQYLTGVYLDPDSIRRSITLTDSVTSCVQSALVGGQGPGTHQRSKSIRSLSTIAGPSPREGAINHEKFEKEVEYMLGLTGLGGLEGWEAGDLPRGKLLRLLVCMGLAKGVSLTCSMRRKAGSALEYPWWKWMRCPTDWSIRDGADAGAGVGTSAGAGAEAVARLGGVGPVLCMDELLEFEDRHVQEEVESLLRQLCHREGVTVLSATHNMHHARGLLAGADTGRVLTFSEGQVTGITPIQQSVYMLQKQAG